MMHLPLGRGDGSEGARAIPNMLKNSALFTENGALSVRPTERRFADVVRNLDAVRPSVRSLSCNGTKEERTRTMMMFCYL